MTETNNSDIGEHAKKLMIDFNHDSKIAEYREKLPTDMVDFIFSKIYAKYDDRDPFYTEVTGAYRDYALDDSEKDNLETRVKRKGFIGNVLNKVDDIVSFFKINSSLEKETINYMIKTQKSDLLKMQKLDPELYEQAYISVPNFEKRRRDELNAFESMVRNITEFASNESLMRKLEKSLPWVAKIPLPSKWKKGVQFANNLVQTGYPIFKAHLGEMEKYLGIIRNIESKYIDNMVKKYQSSQQQSQNHPDTS